MKIKTQITVTFEGHSEEDNEIEIVSTIPDNYNFDVTVKTYEDAINFVSKELIADFSDTLAKLKKVVK